MVRAEAGFLSLSQKLSWMETMYARVRSPNKLKAALARAHEQSWQRDFAASVLRRALIEGLSSSLFELGVPKGKNSMHESWRRFKNYCEYSKPESGNLREWLLAVSKDEDPGRIKGLDEQVFAELVALIQTTRELTSEELDWIRRTMADAVFSLSLEIPSLISDGKTQGEGGGDVVISALDLQIACRRMSSADERFQVVARDCLDTLLDCRRRLKENEQGFTAYERERTLAIIDRLEMLVSVLSIRGAGDLPASLRKLMIALVEGAVADRDFTRFFKKHSVRVSHDLAERMGVVGEKYIARTTKEYLGMLHRAGGAGLITAGTIVAKFAMASMSSNILLGGVFASLNYVISFLLMQFFGFRLATKQPSLTASTLVNRLKSAQFHLHLPQKSQKLLSEIADDVASIARSQVAAALGNFGVVIPATILFHFAYRWYQGTSFLSVPTAHHAIESLNPFHTLTVPFAIFTGVLLWLSTLLASFVERWAVSAGYADRASKGLFGISSCIFLGLLLAIAPTIGAGFGFPIDVRHFTLSTGSLTLAVCSLGLTKSLQFGFWQSFVGLFLIGVFNFGISFALSLTWSALARGVRRAHLTQVFGMAFRFRGFPAHFFYPSAATSMGFSQRR